MSATELRRASETLRERAGNAYCKCGSSACTPQRGWFGPGEALERLDSAGAANYVSVMTPAVGLALADWLEGVALTWAHLEDQSVYLARIGALNIARIINGGGSDD